MSSGEFEKNYLSEKIKYLMSSNDPTPYDVYIYTWYLSIKEFLIGENNLVKKGAGLFGFSRIKPSEQRISNKYFVDK